MLGLWGFFKGQPTEYVIRYANGRVVQEGQGLAFVYWRPSTSIAVVPTSSNDVGFVFHETTGNFQSVTIQGQFTYRIADPRRAAGLLNFTIEPKRRAYLSGDADKLPQRITNVVQMEARREVLARSLEQTLRETESIAAGVQARIETQNLLDSLGVELLAVYVQSAKPTPEVGKALEASYRETLLRNADEAIYARRGAAVAEERKIKESELATDIALEEQRQQFIGLQGANAEQEADFRGRALEREAGYRARAQTLELSAYQTLDPKAVLALGLRELGQNASKIGNLTITSEILAALFNGPASAATPLAARNG
jgi:regulator of protease activity HflC (stomatin/prohibitin superfamily)